MNETMKIIDDLSIKVSGFVKSIKLRYRKVNKNINKPIAHTVDRISILKTNWLNRVDEYILTCLTKNLGKLIIILFMVL